MNEVIGNLCPPPTPTPTPTLHGLGFRHVLRSCLFFFFFSFPCQDLLDEPPPPPPPQTFKNDDTNERIVNLNSYTCKMDYS